MGPELCTQYQQFLECHRAVALSTLFGAIPRLFFLPSACAVILLCVFRGFTSDRDSLFRTPWLQRSPGFTFFDPSMVFYVHSAPNIFFSLLASLVTGITTGLAEDTLHTVGH